MSSPRSRSTEITRGGWEMLASFGARFSVRAGELEAVAMVPPPKGKFHGSVACTVTAKVFPLAGSDGRVSRLKSIQDRSPQKTRAETADKRKMGGCRRLCHLTSFIDISEP